MKKSYYTLGAVALVVVISIFYFVHTYNNFVSANESINQSWSQVENQYQRRADLIPNLVSTVKGVANFEKSTYVEVSEARASVGKMQVSPEILNNPDAFRNYQKAQDRLGGAVSRLLVAVERYPELKANENFMELQSQLEGTENRIARERGKFNEQVMSYNVHVKRFPAVMIANITGYREKAYFQAAQGAEAAPQVKF